MSKQQEPERQWCSNCRFYRSQSCMRHAPVLNNHPGEFPRPVWPFTDGIAWCGDWEPVPVPSVSEEVAGG